MKIKSPFHNLFKHSSLFLTMKYRRGLFLLAYNQKENNIKYLLLKRKFHWKGWEFPKGGIEKNESLLKTIKREIKEETNQKPLKITKHSLSGKYKYSKKLLDRPNTMGQTYSLYSIQLKTQEIKIDKKEHSTYKWVTYSQALKLLTWPNQRKCLRQVNKHLTKK